MSMKKQHGLASVEKEHVKLIAKCFRDTFYEDAEPMPDLIPTPIKTLFYQSPERLEYLVS